MAAALPAKLRTPEIQRFAKRAAQLEKFRPIVTYWCEYYILQQILSKQLHVADDDTSNYAVQLMDKLENVKSESPNNDAIIDDVAAKAYVENFALETFTRADEAQRTNKVTIQTADTFQAASTFMDLLSIWGDLDMEISAKIKFAKFHAMRIVKAVKAGEDPNSSNPAVEEPPAPSDEGLEAELKGLEQEGEAGAQDTYHGPTVESAPDVDYRGTDAMEATGVTEAATAGPMSDSATVPLGAPTDGASPRDAPPAVARQGSIGGGYFPEVPSAPSAADVDMADSGAIQPGTLPSQPPEQPQEPRSPQDFYNQAGNSNPAPPTSAPPQSPLSQMQSAAQRPIVEHSPSNLPAVVPPPAPILSAPPPQAPPPDGAFRTDDESTMAAQKHAKWAISALNFEDVNTAVKELRLALQSLGAA